MIESISIYALGVLIHLTLWMYLKISQKEFNVINSWVLYCKIAALILSYEKNKTFLAVEYMLIPTKGRNECTYIPLLSPKLLFMKP